MIWGLLLAFLYLLTKLYYCIITNPLCRIRITEPVISGDVGIGQRLDWLFLRFALCKCQVKMSKNAHLKCTILSGQSVVGIIKDIPAFNTVRMTCNLDNIAVMNQTIDYCVSNDRVTEDVRPF